VAGLSLGPYQTHRELHLRVQIRRLTDQNAAFSVQSFTELKLQIWFRNEEGATVTAHAQKHKEQYFAEDQARIEQLKCHLSADGNQITP